MNAIVESNGDREADYVEAAGEQIRRDRASVEKWMTDVCPECGEQVDEFSEDHIVDELEDGQQVLLIGCEGFWLINPNMVGIDSPNWQDWTVEEEAPATKKPGKTLDEVIEMLIELRDNYGHGQSRVMVASQPSYPLSNYISNITTEIGDGDEIWIAVQQDDERPYAPREAWTA